MKKLNYLFFIIPVLFFLLSISTKASSQITLPTTYIQVGVGNDEMLEEENLTYISGFVNFQVEGTYLVTYTDRQNNIYKKQFVIIPEDDNQYLLTIEKEHMINSPNTEEIVDVFYITDYNYYVVSNYQQEDPTAPDQEKICITYYENNTYKWEYRYYKYSRYVKGILKEKNLIITGLVYNENNDYINTIVLLEITKDRQIIKTREIQSSDSCYIYGIHYFENNIYLITSTNGNGFDYELYKSDYIHRLVILKLDYNNFKIIDGYSELELKDFYIIDTSFYAARITVNIGYKQNQIKDNYVITNSIFEYDDQLNFYKKYDYNMQTKDYIDFQVTNKDICFFFIDQFNKENCVKIQYLNSGVNHKNILLDLENEYNINDVKIVKVSSNDIYLTLNHNSINNKGFMGFAKINSETGLEYFPLTYENYPILSTKTHNGYIINTYIKDNNLYYKSYNLTEFRTNNEQINDVLTTKKQVIVNTVETKQENYIDTVNKNIYGNYINITILKDQFNNNYILPEKTIIPLNINITSEQVYQQNQKLKFNGYGILNGEAINDGYVIKDIGKYLLEIEGENTQKTLISFEIEDLTMSYSPKEEVIIELKKFDVYKSNNEKYSNVNIKYSFDVKEDYSNIVPLAISVISFVCLSVILWRKK